MSTLPTKSSVPITEESPVGYVGAAASKEAHEPCERTGNVRQTSLWQRNHWRRQDDAVEPAAAAVTGADRHGCAHGVAERENRRRAIGQHHLLHHRLEVGDVVGKVSHVALVAIRKTGDRKGLARANRKWRPQIHARADRVRSRNISR